MQTERASELGLCFGVRRALDLLREASLRYGALQTLGPLAHNRVLLHELESKGIETVDTIEGLTGPVVIVSAHGVAPDTMRRLHERHFTIIDTTCPNVARAQRIAAQMAHDGLTIVIFGDEHHIEVRGLLGWAGVNSLATRDAAALAAPTASHLRPRLGVISQTTQREDEFADFVTSVRATALAEDREVHVVNTLCDATRRRQAAAAELACRVDAMVVIGGRNSANTTRLSETCAAIVETYLVETAEELQPDSLRGKTRIGVTAGASTPDSSIEQVEARLREF